MSKSIVLILAVALAISAFLALRGYESDVPVSGGLTPDSAVHDFLNASKAVRSRWLEGMCNDGVCLDPLDWKCGYSFTTIAGNDLKTDAGHEILFRDIRRRRECFETLAATAPITDTLG